MRQIPLLELQRVTEWSSEVFIFSPSDIRVILMPPDFGRVGNRPLGIMKIDDTEKQYDALRKPHILVKHLFRKCIFVSDPTRLSTLVFGKGFDVRGRPGGAWS